MDGRADRISGEPRYSRSMDERADVVVIGGGLFGAAIA